MEYANRNPKRSAKVVGSYNDSFLTPQKEEEKEKEKEIVSAKKRGG